MSHKIILKTGFFFQKNERFLKIVTYVTTKSVYVAHGGGDERKYLKKKKLQIIIIFIFILKIFHIEFQKKSKIEKENQCEY